MSFFEIVKKKIKKSNILWIVGSAVGVVVSILFAVFNGFSTDKDMGLFLRGTGIGIPIPDWLWSCFDLLFAVGFSILFVKSIINTANNKEYQAFLDSAQKLGDLRTLDAMLGGMPSNPLAKSGDLRFNQMVFFYLEGTDATLIATSMITGVSPIQERYKSSINYYVAVSYADQTIKIPVKKENMIPLCNAVIAEINNNPGRF